MVKLYTMKLKLASCRTCPRRDAPYAVCWEEDQPIPDIDGPIPKWCPLPDADDREEQDDD